MFTRTSLIITILLFSTTVALGQVDPPRLDPTPSTGQQALLIRDGVKQHDRGNYDAAIKRYEEVLNENPNNVEAIYEMSFSYSMKNEPRKSLEAAYKGAMYKSDMLPAFYVQIGNNLDLLGEPEKSIKVYKAGIKMMPKMALLHFNLAVTYRNMGKLDDARKTVKHAVTLDPQHPGSHAVLAGMWHDGRYRTPSLFAAGRFLVLEPRSQRAVGLLKIVKEVMGAGVSAGPNNQINIFFDTAAKKDEGDFGSIDLILGLGKAASMTGSNKGKSEMQLLVGQFETFLAIMSEQSGKADRSKFTWKFYAPYFFEMKQKNYVEPFVYYITQVDGKEETAKWLATNKTRVADFLAWSKSFKWPESEK
ncbi:MAG TPA: tetratricopeptide repeat protein [Pyrinomonadaceae bacterium]|nr:tetratricopeptide repeat protein [Pyrinomonadaceae bacterium]